MPFDDLTNHGVVVYARERRVEKMRARTAAIVDRVGETRRYVARAEAPKKTAPHEPVTIRRSILSELTLKRYARLEAIVAAQNRACYLCGGPFGDDGNITRDHVTPRKIAGDVSRNILMAHIECNQTKADRTPFACELIYLDAVNITLAARSVDERDGHEHRRVALT